MKTPQLPVASLSKTLGIINEVWLKREDQHHYGSHKGRSIPLMITEHHRAGATHFCVSSSGNAALAAVIAVQAHNRNKPQEPFTLQVFIGKNIDPDKLTKLRSEIQDTHITLEQVENPKQQAHQWEADGKGVWLRQSTDDLALVGYHELASELGKIPNLSAVFIPTSSGTTAEGLAQGFEKLGLKPQIHIVQTVACHPIADELLSTPFTLPLSPSVATAIVDQVAHRKSAVVDAVKKSGGAGWIATNQEIADAIKITQDATGIKLSPNSALSVVGLTQAIQAGWKWGGSVVCLVTGK